MNSGNVFVNCTKGYTVFDEQLANACCCIRVLLITSDAVHLPMQIISKLYLILHQLFFLVHPHIHFFGGDGQFPDVYMNAVVNSIGNGR